MTASLEEEESDGGNNGGAGQIEQTFECINSKQVRDGQSFFARQQQRPHRFAGTAKKENGRKASERHRVNRSEARRPQVSLEDFPAQRTQRVAGIDSDNRKNQQERIGVADGRAGGTGTSHGYRFAWLVTGQTTTKLVFSL